MDHIVTFIVCLSLIFTSCRVGSAPAPNDIISGREFLSILMTPASVGAPPVGSSAKTQLHKVQHHHQPQQQQQQKQQRKQQPGSFRGLRKFQHFYYEQPEQDDSILPIEALFSSHEDMSPSGTYFYGNRRDQRQQPVSRRAPTRAPAAPATGDEPVAGSTEAASAPHSAGDDGTSSTTPSSPAVAVTTLAATTAGSQVTDLMEAFATTGMPAESGKSSPDQNEVTVAAATTEAAATEEQPYTTELAPAWKSGQRNAKAANYLQMLGDARDPATMPAARVSNVHRSRLSVEELGQAVSKDQPDLASKEPVAVGDDRRSRSDAQLEPVPYYRTQRKQNTKGTLQSFASEDRKDRLKSPSSVSYSFAPGSTNADSAPEAAGLTASAGRKGYSDPARYYSQPAQFYSEPAKVYSEPAKVYGEPEKVYSQPARMYSEPAKVYSEPARVYSEPAKVYSEPAKVYSQPSSYWQTAYPTLNLTATVEEASTTVPGPPATTGESSPAAPASTSTLPPQAAAPPEQRERSVFNELDKIPYDQLNAPKVDSNTDSIHSVIGKFVPKQSHTTTGADHEEPEQAGKLPAALNRTPGPVPPDSTYAVNGTPTDDRQPPVVVQTLVPAIGSADDSKVGYVVEGRNYRKYRVEEKTPDGFIVGEYGVLSHNDGNLRGVRYTADSDINPRLIYDALLKFLSL